MKEPEPEPALYQIVRGPDLTPFQVEAVLKCFPNPNSQWAYRKAFYFDRRGKRFLEVWRDL